MTKFFEVSDIGAKKFVHHNLFLGLSKIIVGIRCGVHLILLWIPSSVPVDC